METKFLEKKMKRAKQLLHHYNWLDKKKFGECGDLDEEWIMINIFGKKCVYCETSQWSKLGCDRIDNNKPHTKDNCVCACARCNRMRGDNFTVEEMKKIGKAIKVIEKKKKKEIAEGRIKSKRGKKVARINAETGEVLKVYNSTVQTIEDGYNRSKVGKAANHYIDSNGKDYSLYRGCYWEFIK